MTQRTFITVTGVVYLLITLLHGLRVLFAWEAVIGGWRVPQGVSWLAVGVFGVLTVTAWRLRHRA